MAAQRLARFSEDDKKLSCTLVFIPENLTTDVDAKVKMENAGNHCITPNCEPKSEIRTKLEVKRENTAEPRGLKKKIENDTEEDRLLKRQKRFGTVQEKTISTTVLINGASIITRDGKVAVRNYPKVEYSTSYNPLTSPFDSEETFEVEEKGYKSIPMNFFNKPVPYGWMGPAGVIVDYMISKGMMKEPPWAKNSSTDNPDDETDINFGRIGWTGRWNRRNPK